MNDLLKLAKDDLTRLETEAEEARLAYEKAGAAVEDQRAFVLKLELYATGFSAVADKQERVVASLSGSPVPPQAFANVPTVIDGLQRKMALTIPREGTKRYEIGNAAMRAIRTLGPLSTADLLPHIPEELFEGSSNPRNYLSNALSKDARVDNSPRGWIIKASPPSHDDIEEAI